MISKDAVVRRRELLSGDIDEQTVLMSVDAGHYYGLNAIGSRIWLLLEKPQRIADICATLTAEFEVSNEQCEADVNDYLERLAEHNLIEVTLPRP